MRRYLIRLLICLLTVTLGISLATSWSLLTSNLSIPPLPTPYAVDAAEISAPFLPFDPCNLSGDLIKEASFVVSIPSDRELYVGTKRVALDDLTDIANRQMESKACECRGAYIKVADAVKYRTLDLVRERLRAACVNRIWLIGNRNRKLKTVRIH